MNVALVGYGKMGKAIEEILKERGHQVSYKISIDNPEDLQLINSTNTDVAIEFTAPDAAFDNILSCLENKVPVVSGSTGWLDRLEEVKKKSEESGAGFFYASNYSLGVNIFFRLNQTLAKMMNGRDYQVDMLEVHHTQKLDAPSGTAITLAEGLIDNMESKKGWVNERTKVQDKVGIMSERTENVPGTHEVTYSSEVDTIKISHVAHSRKGFALGAVLAAEYLEGKSGVHSMDDLINF